MFALQVVSPMFTVMSHSQRMSENFQVVSAEFWRDQTRCLCSLEQLENILTSWKFHKIILFVHKNYQL